MSAASNGFFRPALKAMNRERIKEYMAILVLAALATPAANAPLLAGLGAAIVAMFYTVDQRHSERWAMVRSGKVPAFTAIWMITMPLWAAGYLGWLTAPDLLPFAAIALVGVIVVAIVTGQRNKIHGGGSEAISGAIYVITAYLGTLTALCGLRFAISVVFPPA